MNIFALSGLLTAITSGAMALLMFLKGKRLLHYLWGTFCVSVILWGFGGYKIATTIDPIKAVLWWKIAYIGVIFIPILFTHFVHEFLNINRKWLIWVIYFLGFFFLASNLFTDLFINKVRWVFNQFYYISPPAPLYTPFFILFIGLVIYTHIILWQAYRTAPGIQKTQIKYLFIATSIGFGGGSFSYLPVYNIDLYPFLNLAVFPFSPIVAYAIFKYRLMDLRIVARNFFIYIGVGSFSYGVFYLVTWVYNELFGGVYNTGAYISGIFISLAFAVGFYSFGKILLKVANKYFFISLYNYQETINKLSEELNYYNDLDKIINLIVDTIKKTMKLNRAGVLLINQNKKPVHYQIAKVVGFNEQNGISLVQDSFLTKYLQKIQKPLVKDELLLLSRDARVRNHQQNFKRLYDHMKHIEASLCLPLMSNNKLIGIIVLGAKISNEAYTKEDLELLTTLAYQAGIAIDNAKLYKEVQDFNKTLKQKVYEQTKDIQEKNIYLEELLNMKTDFLRVVNHQLNTPLSVMRNAFALVDEKVLTSVRGMEFASRGLERMSQTISDFWDAFQLEGQKMEMTPEKVDIENIINNLVEDKKLIIVKEKNMKIEIQKPKFKIPPVWCDSKKIPHVISNLLDNAVWYTPKGSVTITYEMPNKDFLKVSVKDTGVGISKETKEKLFQKFFRGQGASTLHPDGSGLGLYVAKKIVEGNNGELTFISEEAGKGSTFSFTLPIYFQQDTKLKTSKEALTIKQ